MAQPQWVTSAGNLGTYAENLFFSLPLLAIDPDGGTVKYVLVAGSLPEGIQVKINGSIEGIPVAYAKVQGVPKEVGENITSRFAIRAYVEVPGGTPRVADRTFSITVAGQDLPEFVTPAGNLGYWYDGDAVEYTIEFTDTDPGENVIVSLEDGELPPGVTISPEGVISGYIEPIAPISITAIAGYDATNTAYDEFPMDFTTRSISKNYQFTLGISDGKDQALRTFEMFVIAKNSLTADVTDVDPERPNVTGFFTADNDHITADVLPQRTPLIINYPENGDIGLFRHNNFFAYQFQGLDLDGDPLAFEIALGDSSDLPPGLTLNVLTGWLYGYLPDQGATETTFNFDLYVLKRDNPTIISEPYSYSITTIGDIDTEVTWLTKENVGTLNNGEVSTLKIEATNLLERSLQYRLKPGAYPDLPGVYNKLPQGLSLLPSGDISGCVTFNTFAIDNGTTTFDKERATRLKVDETTFDSQFNFTVEAYSVDGVVSVFKSFYITVNRKYNAPYESLYCQAMPSIPDRELLDSLLLNQDIMNPRFIYRPTDPYYGVARRIIYTHAYGLESASLATYVDALNLNHYRKELILGELKTARALDPDGNTIYEVVYSEIVDTGVNDLGQSPGQSVPVPYPFELDGETITEVYPNSLIEMRDQVIDVVGQYAEVLPLWMRSKQANGTVLGFTKAWVLAYCLPGKAEQLVYKINTEWEGQLNLLEFEVDRYTLDRQMTKNWVPFDDSTVSGEWLPAESTTFDVVPEYILVPNSDSTITGGTDYAIGDQIRISGANLGGENTLNDVLVTVGDVDTNGTITVAFAHGQAPDLATDGTIYYNVSGTNVTGSGTGATFDIQVNISGVTTFDDNSIRFNTPVDMYGLTDRYNKYLVFPKTNILN